VEVGDLEVLPVFDGLGYEVAREVLRRPGHDDPWAPHSGHLDAGRRLEFTLGGFLVRGNGRVMLVDTGAGTISNAKYTGGRFLSSLSAHGVQPGDVTDVLFTHLHFDHVGWASQQGRVVFPGAAYWVHEADWEHFVTGPAADSGAVRKLSPLAPQLRTFTGPCAIAPGVTARPAAGHTPGSVIYVLESGGQRALLLGDVVHSVAELLEPGWRFLFDSGPEAAARVREAISAELRETGVPAAAAHFPGLRFGRFTSEPGHREWVFL
jgi:glyoxylase-like metal-dependent hydrolase (beta-lactamase superfamily II)